MPPSEAVSRHPFDTVCLAGSASEWTADNWRPAAGAVALSSTWQTEIGAPPAQRSTITGATAFMRMG